MKKWVALLGFIGLFIPLISLSTSARAESGPVIHQLQVGAIGITNKEYISVYNNSPTAIDVTGWCLKYGEMADTASLGCLNAPDSQTRLWLPAHGYMTAASNAFKADYSTTNFDITFPSASIASTNRYVRLIDSGGTELDRLGWGSGKAETTPSANPISPNILQRLSLDGATLKDTNNNLADFEQIAAPTLAVSNVYEIITPTDVCPNLSGLQTAMPPGYLADASGNCLPDVCANIDGLQTGMPTGYESSDGENCTPIPLENATLLITELLPNAVSYDTGNEFIELYNPNDRPVSLSGYKLQLGPDFTKSYDLPDQIIAPGAYLVFSDSQTGLVLSNTTASLRLVAPSGNVVHVTGGYDQPGENSAWALIDGIWQYTNRPTPGAANLPTLIETTDTDESTTAAALSLVPCRADQERNPETNRCRLIQTAAASLVPCGPGQERNPATNRCRSSLSGDDGTLVPCKEGQERNPETNRCRSAASAANALVPCTAGQERNPDTNRCRKSAGGAAAGIAGVKDVASGSIGNNPKWLLAGLAVVAALGYAAYEWRHEMSAFLVKTKSKLMQTIVRQS